MMDIWYFLGLLSGMDPNTVGPSKPFTFVSGQLNDLVGEVEQTPTIFCVG
jgi:hypothetical protein